MKTPVIFLGLCLIILSASLYSQPNAPKNFEHIYSPTLNQASSDYNFWLGHWDVTWKKWNEGGNYKDANFSQHRLFAALNGKALIELAYGDSLINGAKTTGFSIRYFDKALDKWVMFQSWPGKNAPNVSSLQGKFHHKRIELFQQGVTTRPQLGYPSGTRYDNRYTFSDTHENSFRWESSFSLDSMKTWLTLNIAEGIRKDDFNSLVDEEGNWFTYADGCNCDDSLLLPLKPFIGNWSGQIEYSEKGNKINGTVFRALHPFLGGCAALGYQINFTKKGMHKEIIFLTYLPRQDEWIFFTLNDKMGQSCKIFYAKEIGKSALFEKREVFNVPSSGSLNDFTWQLSGLNEQVIKGTIPDKDWSFKIFLKKEQLHF